MKKREVKYRTKLFLNSLKVSLKEIIFRVKCSEFKNNAKKKWDVMKELRQRQEFCNTESILRKKLVIEKERYDLNKRYSRKI